jgi:hypothetical protein
MYERVGSPFSRDERDGAEGAGQQGHVLEDSQGRSNVFTLYILLQGPLLLCI